MGVMEKMRKGTGIILWVLIFSFGILWALADTKVFDAMQAGPSSLGQVNGESISLEEYNSRISYYLDQYSQQTGKSVTPEMRANYENQAWEELVKTKLIQQKMDALGITVTDQEVINMITGPNPDSFIRQQFEREDGTIDRVALQSAIEAPENSDVWIMVEQQLRQKRRQQKMSNYVQSAMVVSSYEVEQEYIRNNTYADILYLRFPYAEVSDSELEVLESELKSHYRNNLDNYKRKESYRFKYATFDKTPTKEDTMRIINEMKDLRSDFASTENDSLFLARYQSSTLYSVEFVDKNEVREIFRPVLELKKGKVSNVIKSEGTVYTLKKLDETADQVKFVVFSLDIKADPIATVDKKAEEADDFSFFAEQDGFEQEAERRELEVQEAFATKGNNFIPGIGQSRQIMNYLTTSSEGDISKPIELSDQFVVLKVSEILPEGPRPFDEVKGQIRNQVTNNKRKEKVVDSASELLDTNTALTAMAEEAGKEIARVDGLHLNDNVIEGAGREPQVVGAIFGLNEGELSGVIEGQNAAFVVKVRNRQDAQLNNLDSATRQQIRRRLQQEKGTSFTQIWLDELKEEADIEDYRASVLRSQ